MPELKQGPGVTLVPATTSLPATVPMSELGPKSALMLALPASRGPKPAPVPVPRPIRPCKAWVDDYDDYGNVAVLYGLWQQ